jgi:hypothetical protein
MLQPGESIRPHLSRQAAITLVQRLYGLRDITIDELNGYDDKNYHVQVSEADTTSRGKTAAAGCYALFTHDE